MPGTSELVRALKDEDYRLSLTGGALEHPAGDPAGEVYVSASEGAANTCESWASCARLCSL
jgi:hypothetical protein